MSTRSVELALEAAGLGVLVLDEAGRVIEGTRSAADILGRKPDDLIGRPFASILPIDPEVATEFLSTAPASPKSVLEVTIGDAADHRDALIVNLVHWVDPEGNRRTSAILKHVATEKERARIAKKELVQSNHAIQGANIGVFEYDLATETVSVSRIWREMLELDAFENLDVQLEWRSRVHPDDLTAALEPIRLCGEDLAERARCEYRLRSRDGSRWLWMQTDIAVSMRDERGRPTVLVGAQTDITARKQAEEALRVSVEQLRAAFDYAPIGKGIVGLSGQWRRVNSALCELLGYSETELLKIDVQSLSHPEDLETYLTFVESLLTGASAEYSLDTRFLRATGAVMWVRLSLGVVRDAQGQPNHFILQIVDMTEERRLNDVRSQFVSVVSHELRTPLTAVLGSLTLLSTYDDEQFPDEIQRLLYIAKVNGDRLHNLINDILDFQKFSAREMRFAVSKYPVAALVEDSLLANLASADRHGVRFVPQIADRTLVAMVDSKRFQQVMANLLSNATKFARQGSEVLVAVEPQDQEIRVSVSNAGAGIPEAFRDRVFKPFSQAGSVSDRRSGGTGLGLSITKQIVEQMGGRIGFDSIPDERTTFWFTVPTVTAHKANDAMAD